MNILPIVSTLQASAAATAVLGDQSECMKMLAPRKTDFPYAVWSVVHGEPDNNLDCPGLTTIVFDFKLLCMTATKSEHLKLGKSFSQVLKDNTVMLQQYIRAILNALPTNIFGRGFDANWFFRSIVLFKFTTAIKAVLFAKKGSSYSWQFQKQKVHRYLL